MHLSKGITGNMVLLGVIGLSACGFDAQYEKLFGEAEQFTHRPAMVMFVNEGDIKADGASITIDMEKINIGGQSAEDILKRARNWRLNVFTLNGDYLDGSNNYNTDHTIHLQKIPVDKLVRADLDLHPKRLWKSAEAEVGPEAEVVTASFLVLLHKYPD
jgi:hypothetical protein